MILVNECNMLRYSENGRMLWYSRKKVIYYWMCDEWDNFSNLMDKLY